VVVGFFSAFLACPKLNANGRSVGSCDSPPIELGRINTLRLWTHGSKVKGILRIMESRLNHLSTAHCLSHCS